MTLPPDLDRALADHADGEALGDVWRRLDGADPDAASGAPSDADAWAALQHRLTPPTHAAPDRPPARRASRRVRWRWAGVAAAVAVAAVVWLGVPVTERAGTAETRALALPDGSRVELAAETEIRYARGFWSATGAADVRAVTLVGEAFFDVEADGRPFVVETHDAAVTVLGTRFGVRARPEDRAPGTYVVVEEGAVRVGVGAGAVVLAPGQAVSVGDTPPVAVEASAQRVTAWRRGGFAVENRPLGDVLAEVERRFGVVVGAEPGVPLGVPMTLYYQADADAESVVHDLALAAGLRYRPVQGGFRLTVGG